MSDLEAAGIPFRLKATFVASGDKDDTGTGTYEEWWEGVRNWRKEATLGKFRYVAIKNGSDDPNVYTSSDYVPVRLRQMLKAVMIRISANLGATGKWTIKPKKIKGIEFTRLRGPCELIEPDPNGAGPKQIMPPANMPGCVQQALFTSEGVLRLRAQDSLETVYDNFSAFENRFVPFLVMVTSDNRKQILDVSIGMIEPLQDSKTRPSLAEIPTDLKPFDPLGSLVRDGLAKGASPPRLAYIVDTHPPPNRKLAGVNGSVVIQAIIDADGNVYEPHVIRSDDSRLNDAALLAATQWKFAPATFHGNTVAVQMDFMISFHSH